MRGVRQPEPEWVPGNGSSLVWRADIPVVAERGSKVAAAEAVPRTVTPIKCMEDRTKTIPVQE